MSQVQSPISSTTPDALRAAIAEAVQVDAQQLQSAVGSIQVATSEQLQVTDPQIKSLYDADSRTLTLLVDRIPAGQEAEDFAAALIQHLGHDISVDLIDTDYGCEIYVSPNRDTYRGGFEWSICKDGVVLDEGLDFTEEDARESAQRAIGKLGESSVLGGTPAGLVPNMTAANPEGDHPLSATHELHGSPSRYALAVQDADAGLIWSVGGVWSASLLDQTPTLMTGPQADEFHKRHPRAHIVDVIVFREAHKAYTAGVNSVIDHNERSTPQTRQAAREAGIKALVHAGFSENALDIAAIGRSSGIPKERSEFGAIDLVSRQVPSLHEFRDSRQFVTDLHQITGEARDHQVRAFRYSGDVFLRMSGRDATCSIELKQKNWDGQNAVYELPYDLAEGEVGGYFSPPSGAAGVAPGSIVCSQGKDGYYKLASFHRLGFESGMRALEEILYEREYLREHVPVQAAELALRAVYERSPEYSDPQLGGGDFMQMVEKFAEDSFYAYHHLAKHLQQLSDKIFENCDIKADDSPTPGM